MLVDNTPTTPQVDKDKAKQTSCLEVFLRQICGDCKTLSSMILNNLLVLVTESDWALSAILGVDYIKPLEEYCSKTQPCDVPIALPKLLFLLGSLFPSLLSASTDRSSKLVPFAARLCYTLAEHVSEMKSHFTESSPSDGTISALSPTLPDEAPLLTRNTVAEVISEGFSLCYSMLGHMFTSFLFRMSDGSIVPLLKSTIIACLDLLEQLKSESNCPPTDQQYKLTNILDTSWNSLASILCDEYKSLHPIVQSTFSDLQQLCLLVERTCYHSSPTQTSHLRMIINDSASLPRLIPRMLEENIIQRVIDVSKPMTVSTSHGVFHLSLLCVMVNMLGNPLQITNDEEEQKKIRLLEFERALKPAKQYLQFILQRDEFIPNVVSNNRYLQTQIATLLSQTLVLERDLFEDGEIVETGREEWEVGWLVEKTQKDELGTRLTKIRDEDVRMKKDEKSRWKKRVERQREAGHEDAMEGLLTRRGSRTQSEIVEYMKYVGKESGMNVRF
ncbi:hypothetical protein BLNAU_10933 [Blattamonas nauphoetae]|uniref:Uncharacterized protein n=1 Tax=Blattamonas nauphoetae TaxID=2049346 RepID=A0ABQ9XSU4_9EUKA|nr:hypothetical protein BLNAU_10933 [Blattamonas nauphoetae]